MELCQGMDDRDLNGNPRIREYRLRLKPRDCHAIKPRDQTALFNQALKGVFRLPAQNVAGF